MQELCLYRSQVKCRQAQIIQQGHSVAKAQTNITELNKLGNKLPAGMFPSSLGKSMNSGAIIKRLVLIDVDQLGPWMSDH